MTFLEVDVQGSDHICRDLMDDLTAIEDESDESREFIGNAHCISISPDGVSISANLPSDDTEPTVQTSPTSAVASIRSETPIADNLPYQVDLRRFREVLEDWEAFILDDQIDDTLLEDEYS